MEEYLQETYFINFSHEAVQQFIAKHTDEKDSLIEKTIKLYYGVRDKFWYHPLRLSFTKTDWQASEQIIRNYGHCIDKSNIMIACLRAIGIPARFHLSKVRNHIGVEKIIEKIGTDELTPHAYVEAFLEDKWVKLTPVFNQELCEMLQVHPLDFDGKNDALFQAFDKNGQQFMEYLEDYGTFADLPFDFVIDKLKTHYPIEILASINKNPLV